MDFATTLKLLRTLRHLSQVELAKAAGVAPTCMSYLEAGKILPAPNGRDGCSMPWGTSPSWNRCWSHWTNLEASETQPHSA